MAQEQEQRSKSGLWRPGSPVMCLYSLQYRCSWFSKTAEVGVFSRKTTGRARGPGKVLRAWGQ